MLEKARRKSTEKREIVLGIKIIGHGFAINHSNKIIN